MAGLSIDSIAAGGDGVGRNNGLVVFVPRTAPGDVVTARTTGKGRFARGLLNTIVSPSADRIDPPCVHYTRDRCGGCQLQHMRYGAQLDAKKRIISDSIQRIAKRGAAGPAGVLPSPKEWRYRTRLTLAMRRRGERWIAGLHRYDVPSEIFALADCPITESSVVATWKEVMAAESLLPEAKELGGSVRMTPSGATFVLNGGARWPASADFLSAVPSVRALWWQPDDGERRLVEDRRERKDPAASFAQVNPEVAAELSRALLERIARHSPASAVDAYAGVGDTAAALADSGVRITAIELDAEASEWSARRLAPPSAAIRGRVEDVIAGLLPADVVVVNPPRAGLDARVTESLDAAGRGIRALFYVSCNPATLARDLTRLPAFEIAALEAFDMFPQTAHVETLCELVPSR